MTTILELKEGAAVKMIFFVKIIKHLRDQGAFDQCPIFKPCVNFQH